MQYLGLVEKLVLALLHIPSLQFYIGCLNLMGSFVKAITHLTQSSFCYFEKFTMAGREKEKICVIIHLPNNNYSPYYYHTLRSNFLFTYLTNQLIFSSRQQQTFSGNKILQIVETCLSALILVTTDLKCRSNNGRVWKEENKLWF